MSPNPAAHPPGPGLFLCAALVAGAAAAGAQERPVAPAPEWSAGMPRLPALVAARGIRPFDGPVAGTRDPEGDLSPGRAFLLSAAVPGAAQFALDQWRWPLYVAAEGAAWYGYLSYRGDARDLRSEYRTLAWEVPRRGFADERRDGDFEYYERMADWPTSGAFDADPARAGLQPEPDASTYNGSVWRLARDLFGVGGTPDPDSEAYGRALEYYRDRAVSEAFRWDWDGRSQERERFRSLISTSDRKFGRATAMVGILVGNHLLSAIDGYLSARLRRRGLPGARVRLSPGGGGAWRGAWTLQVEIARR